jgi:hypothetical protein
LEQQLEAILRRVDQAYSDILDGKIPKEPWQRKMSDWQAEEQRIEMAIAGFSGQRGTDRLLKMRREF